MRKIPLLLAAATLIPIGALTWLGARILQQDREVERQRRREALELAAGRLALDIDRRLRDIEEQLSKGGCLPLELRTEPEAPGSLFAEAEATEFQRRDLDAAA